eukprot:198199_1
MGTACSACSPKAHTIESTDNNIRNRNARIPSISTDQSITTDVHDHEPSQITSTDSTKSESPTGTQPTENDITIAYDGWRKAIESGNETLATYFVETEYPNIDLLKYRWPNGDSALHVAVSNNKARLVFFLLTQGASSNEQSPNTLDAPLHLAVRARNYKIIDLLLKWGADARISNKERETAVTISSAFTDGTIYEMLSDSFEDTAPQLPRGRTNSVRFDALRELASHSICELKQHSVDAKEVLGVDSKGDKKGKDKKELTLKANKIAHSNPFTGLGRRTTTHVHRVVDENLQLKPLPELKAWLQKKKPGGVVNLDRYQRRWIVVKGAHMLWNDKQREIKNDADRRERKKFKGWIHLMTIDKISIIESPMHTKQYKFSVKAKDVKHDNTMRDYIFRCQSRKERDYWVNGLREHKKQYHTG